MLTLIAAIAISVAPPESFDLTPKLKVNDSWSIVSRVEGKTESGPISIESVARQKVESIKDGKVTVSFASSGTIVRMGGEEIRDARSESVTMVFDRLGKLLDVKGISDRRAALLTGAVSRFVAPDHPVAINESWQSTYSGDKDSPNLRFTYHLLKVADGMATVSVDVAQDVREKALKGRGTWMVEVGSGAWQTFEGEFENLAQPLVGVARLTLKREP